MTEGPPHASLVLAQHGFCDRSIIHNSSPLKVNFLRMFHALRLLLDGRVIFRCCRALSNTNNALRSLQPGGGRGYATVTDLSSYPKPGEQLHGFTLKRSKHVPELQLTAIQLEHEKTGAEYLHVARNDENNVFSIGFKTNPPDDTGVPHILEHTTLCGSEK